MSRVSRNAESVFPTFLETQKRCLLPPNAQPTNNSLAYVRTPAIPLCISNSEGDRDCRALALREKNVSYWFWIGDHDEYGRLDRLAFLRRSDSAGT